MYEKPCPLCLINIEQNGGESFSSTGFDYDLRCKKCGNVNITWEATGAIYNKKIRVHLLQGFTRYCTLHNIKTVNIKTDNIDSILSNPIIPKSIHQKYNALLLNLETMTEYAGQYININTTDDYPIGFAKNPGEMRYLMDELINLSFVEKTENIDINRYEIRIISPGWSKIENQKNNYSESKQCFVAMAFREETDQIYENGIKRAVKETGFLPYRIDRDEHAELIPYKMLSEIKKSLFAVADFNFQVCGVYFEAGYALGLNLPVIWTCPSSDFEKAHFDIKQYNHIIYNDVDDLYIKLKTRIEALIVPMRKI